jgi:hypothetical protein
MLRERPQPAEHDGDLRKLTACARHCGESLSHLASAPSTFARPMIGIRSRACRVDFSGHGADL